MVGLRPSQYLIRTLDFRILMAFLVANQAGITAVTRIFRFLQSYCMYLTQSGDGV